MTMEYLHVWSVSSSSNKWEQFSVLCNRYGLIRITRVSAFTCWNPGPDVTSRAGGELLVLTGMDMIYY